MDIVSTRRLIVGPARASYANVWEPKPDEDPSKPAKYGVALVFYPSAETTKQREQLRRMLIEAGVKKFGQDKFAAMVKSGAVLLEGTRGIRTDQPTIGKYPGAEFVINARNTIRPQIVDEHAQPLLDREKFYSGVWCLASIEAYGFDTKGNRGVTFSLGNLQRVRDDERLDNRVSADKEFMSIATASIDEIEDLLK